MADYDTQYAVLLPNVTEKEHAWLLEAQGAFEDADEERKNDAPTDYCGPSYECICCLPCFDASVTDAGGLFLTDETACLSTIVGILEKFFEVHRPEEVLLIPYAETCSRHLTDGFGGGTVLVGAGVSFWAGSDVQEKHVREAYAEHRRGAA